MTPASELARPIVEFDRGVAESLLERELGENPDELGKTTREWKEGFAHAERVRALCTELERLLR